MNVSDRIIEDLRARFALYARECNRDMPLQYHDGFKAGLRQAVIDIETHVRGLSTFEGHTIPEPKEVQCRVWCIPMIWDYTFSAQVEADPCLAYRRQPRLELEKWSDDSWLVRPQVWKP